MNENEGNLYETALGIVDHAVGSGPFSFHELALANEMRRVLFLVSERDLKRKSSRELLKRSENSLFLAACEVMRESAGECSPEDAAQGIVLSFIRCGMDLGKTMEFARTSLFAEMRL